MRLTVGPLPPAVYWRRRAAIAAVLALLVVTFVATCRGVGPSAPHARPDATSSAPVSGPPATPTSGGSGGGPASPSGIDASTSPGPTGSGSTSPSPSTGTGGGSGGGGGTGGGGGGGNVAPPVVATVPCADEEMLLTVAVAPSPALYGGVATLTLMVRNVSDHACYRDVGSGPQELQVSRDGAVLWSSDHCGQPQTSDVRSFGPNIETRFWRTWNTYRFAPHECDPAGDTTPAAVGQYQVTARLGTRVSEPFTFEIRQ